MDKMIQLLGSRSTLERLQSHVPAPETAASWADQIGQFRQIRIKYLIYPAD